MMQGEGEWGGREHMDTTFKNNAWERQTSLLIPITTPTFHSAFSMEKGEYTSPFQIAPYQILIETSNLILIIF